MHQADHSLRKNPKNWRPDPAKRYLDGIVYETQKVNDIQTLTFSRSDNLLDNVVSDVMESK